MKTAFCALVLGLALALNPLAAQAATPPIDGQVSGIELCPKFICGVAIFAGVFQGQIGFIPNATGIVTTAVDHGELPTVIGGSTPIYFGGVWALKSPVGRFYGIVTGG